VVAVGAIAVGGAVLLNSSSSKAASHPSQHPTTHGPITEASAAPTIPGWQVVISQQHGVAYDVPPGWRVEAPDFGLVAGSDASQATLGVGSVAQFTKKVSTLKYCHVAVAGLHGGSGIATGVPSDQLQGLKDHATVTAKGWALATYAGTKGQQPAVSTQPAQIVTLGNGAQAAEVDTFVTPVKGDVCNPPKAFVHVITMAAAQGGAVNGPLDFIILADQGTPAAQKDEVLQQVLKSIRPMKCDPANGPKTGAVPCPVEPNYFGTPTPAPSSS
jgi:hypothetical protein